MTSVSVSNDEHYMNLAIAQAHMARDQDETPVGCIIVKDGTIIGKGFNKRETLNQVCAHAEILALNEACGQLKSWRLVNCEVFVTLEPCLMCAGALLQARVKRVIFGCHDPKGGAFGSLYDLHADKRLNHQIEVHSGVLANECSKMLSTFFASKRLQKASEKNQ